MSPLPPANQQIDQLKEALLNAFTLNELRRLLRKALDADLERLAPTLGQSGDQIVENVVRAYAAQPKGFQALLDAGLAENPGNLALQAAQVTLGERD